MAWFKVKIIKQKFFWGFLAAVLVASAGLICVGCSEKVFVKDIHGNPIANAEIVSASLSMNEKAELTNQKGIGKISHNIQGIKWITISKEGYEPVTIDYEEPWPKKPVEIVLHKQSEAISDEADFDLNHESATGGRIHTN